MAKRGRKSVYETLIKPRFTEINEWLRNGATEYQVYSNLGVGKDAYFKYKREKPEFNELITNAKKSLIIQLRGALMKRAMGYMYTETKTVTTTEDDGTETVRVERTEKYAHPDVAAINLSLKNYDPDNWANDPAYVKIKQEELELKKKAFELNNWTGEGE